MMNKIILFAVGQFLFLCVYAQQINHSKPTPQQLAWHNMEYYWFIHFGPNTFTGKEWGHGDEKEEIFNPTELDCRQWARLAKASGAKGIIITAKHHDGFCLWPSKYSTHTVRESGWRNGKGDVLKELSQACKEYGLKFGVYISPWDRNHPKYGTEEYNDVFVNMLKELFTNYGSIWELWWDGANGEGPNGKKQEYDWRRYENLVRKISPQTIIFSDIGPDCRWVGNEKGFAGTTNWNYLDTAGFKRGAGAPPTDTLTSGNIYGKNWIPAECDVSIRPGWFYHKEEDEKVKTPQQLFELYLKSVGRGANLLLNIPPDGSGLINVHDSVALMGFKKLREENFAAPVAIKKYAAKVPGKEYFLKWNTATKINCIVLKEPIEKGQSIGSFIIRIKNKMQTVKEITGTTVGHKRIITFPAIEADSFEVIINGVRLKPLISEASAYFIEPTLVIN
jgi:alpha-L-fucosidase